MGFGGGGSNQTRPHTHDSNIINDGGSLAANVTQFGLANQSILVSDGVNIQELALGSDGDNLTSLGGALSWEAHVAGDVLASNLVMANSTTIGDYTQPTSATCSSAASTTLSPDWTWDGSATGWTLGTGCVIATSQLAVTNATGVTESRMAYRDVAADLGVPFIGNTWVMRFKVSGTALTNSNPGNAWSYEVTVADTSAYSNESPAGNPVYAGVWVMELTGAGSVGYTFSRAWTNSANQSTASASFVNPITMTWYVQIVNNGTTIQTDAYTNADFSTGLVSSITTTQTTPSDLQGSLKQLNIRSYVQAGLTTASTVYIEDINFWNNVSSITSVPNPCSNAIDNNVATKWQSDVEVNPNIYVDMSSSTTTSNLALYPNAATSETEIKIQSSNDALAWTDQRTITWSNLTEGAWNYIRFNLISARYWRIYGSSGNSVDLEIDEIKVLDSVSDADVRNLHGHIPISSSDTSLNNAGV